jgi:hypothetical protein
MIKARAHKGGVRIGKTPKKLASIGFYIFKEAF